MAESEISLEQVRAAKAGVRRNLGDTVDIVGIGVTRSHGSLALKVNVKQMPAGVELPAEIDGVPVVFEAVGKITPR
jgi:hypothetical protein